MTCLGLWLTVKYLSPCHFLTSDSLITLELNIMIDCYNPNFTLMTNPLFYLTFLELNFFFQSPSFYQ